MSVTDRNIGFDEETFDVLMKYEDWHWWFQYRNRMITGMMQKHSRNPAEILEIGCGNGLVTKAIQEVFPKAHITASEFLEDGLVNARARLSNVTFRQLDARDLGEQDLFDAVCAFDVLEHIDADVDVMKAVRKSMRNSDARFYITVPQHMALWSQADTYARHERRYSFAEMKAKLAEAGFAVEYRSSYVFLLSPLMFLSRLFNKTEADFDVEKEFRISKTGNAILGGVTALEAGLRRIGVPMPFGGSLVVVAKPL